MRATATRIALLIAALTLAAVPAAAGAKAKKKKAKATPVSVVSASQTTSANNELVTVTASCPAGTIVVGGGFEAPTPPGGGTVTDLNLVHESRRASSASWQVSAVRADGGTPGPALAVTALAHCRTPKLKPKATKKAAAAKKKKKKKKKLKITEVSATSAAAPAPGVASATATCPGTQTPISGGFSSSPLPGAAGFAIFYANLRSAANAWTVAAVNAGTVARTVTSYAYCIRPLGPTEKVGSATLPASSAGPPVVVESATATTPACSKSTSLVAGGFSHTPPGLMGGTAIPLPTSSVGSGKSWSAGALNESLVAGSLGARGYCL